MERPQPSSDESTRSIAIYVAVAILVAFMAVLVVRPWVGEPPKASPSVPEKELAPVELVEVELPGVTLGLPVWSASLDRRSAASGVIMRDRGGLQKQMVNVSWSTGARPDADDLEAVVRALSERFGFAYAKGIAVKAPEGLGATQIHAFKVKRSAVQIHLTAFTCPDDDRAFTLQTQIGAKASAALAFHEQVLKTVKCTELGAASEGSAATLVFEPDRPYTPFEVEGGEGFEFEGLGAVVLGGPFPMQLDDAALATNPMLRNGILDAFGYAGLDGFDESPKMIGDPPRTTWSGRVRLVEETDPPEGEFEILLSVVQCGGKSQLAVFLPDGESVPEEGRALFLTVRCGEASGD